LAVNELPFRGDDIATPGSQGVFLSLLDLLKTKDAKFQRIAERVSQPFLITRPLNNECKMNTK